MVLDIDLVISFRVSSHLDRLSKEQVREQVSRAENQYKRLLETLSKAGLRSTGRRGHSRDQILTFVSCPRPVVDRLVKRERHSDFLYGIPTGSIPTTSSDLETKKLSPADRLRIVHGYVTSMPRDGGLGIHPGSPEWDLVDFVAVIKDRQFNDAWVRNWSTHRITSAQINKVREQFGDAVALYFHFLSGYTKALFFPAILGILFHFFGTPFSPIYSILLVLWSIVYVEWWRVQERIIAMRNGTRGSFRVEKRRARYAEGFPWWMREIRVATSAPVILLFITVLSALLTAIFMLEAFVTRLYTGPGDKFISFIPTVVFVVCVPRVLALYHASAVRFTEWENHAHQSTYNASLTLKTFTLSAIVAYLGLALSAFVYLPFGEALMHLVQVSLFEGPGAVANTTKIGNALNATSTVAQSDSNGRRLWNADRSAIRSKLSSSRLQDQMFAYIVTNQAVNAFLEIGLPFIQRGVDRFWTGHVVSSVKKKQVSFEDERNAKVDEESEKEKEILDQIRNELMLPEYAPFEDYSEMITQFGYVAVWSTIWPLAPAMALINNIFESRSDAVKIAVHHRRPIPVRTDTIGPWLDAISFLTWLAALVNSALVYLYRPHTSFSSSLADEEGMHSLSARRRMLVVALLIALAASHVYIVVRGIARHAIERAMWVRSAEVAEMEESEKAVKERYLSGLGGDEGKADGGDEGYTAEGRAFWDREEGLGEIQKLLKEA